MRETYQPTTTSPAGPPRDHTHPRHDHTRPHHSRTHPRHSRESGNPPRCVQTHEETALLPPSTKSTKPDRIRQNLTETRVPARAREATAFRSFLSSWIGFDVSLWSCRPIAAMPINQTEPMRDRAPLGFSAWALLGVDNGCTV